MAYISESQKADLDYLFSLHMPLLYMDRDMLAQREIIATLIYHKILYKRSAGNPVKAATELACDFLAGSACEGLDVPLINALRKTHITSGMDIFCTPNVTISTRNIETIETDTGGEFEVGLKPSSSKTLTKEMIMLMEDEHVFSYDTERNLFLFPNRYLDRWIEFQEMSEKVFNLEQYLTFLQNCKREREKMRSLYVMTHGFATHFVYRRVLALPWPNFLRPWFDRQRPSGWPSRELLLEVLRTETPCAAEPSRKHASSGLKWHLIFPKAEKILLSSLTTTQWKIFRMFKLLLQDVLWNFSAVSSYSVKTIFLWSLEKIPLSRWDIKKSSTIVMYLVDQLILSLAKGSLPHYFLPGVNVLSGNRGVVERTALRQLLKIRRQPINHMVRTVMLHEVDNDDVKRIHLKAISRLKTGTGLIYKGQLHEKGEERVGDMQPLRIPMERLPKYISSSKRDPLSGETIRDINNRFLSASQLASSFYGTYERLLNSTFESGAALGPDSSLARAGSMSEGFALPPILQGGTLKTADIDCLCLDETVQDSVIAHPEEVHPGYVHLHVSKADVSRYSESDRLLLRPCHYDKESMDVRPRTQNLDAFSDFEAGTHKTGPSVAYATNIPQHLKRILFYLEKNLLTYLTHPVIAKLKLRPHQIKSNITFPLSPTEYDVYPTNLDEIPRRSKIILNLKSLALCCLARMLLRAIETEELSWLAWPCHIVDIVRYQPFPFAEEAKGWLHRHRPSGWPGEKLIESITGLGCDVVAVGHVCSRHRDREWRVSFTTAENALAASITETQRDVFLVFKLFLLDETTSFKVITSYYLKTLFFWTLESVPFTYWKRENMGQLTLLLVDKLCMALGRGYLPSYFNPENNLIDHISREQMRSTLKRITRIRRQPISSLQEFYARAKILTPDALHDLLCGKLYPSYIKYKPYLEPCLEVLGKVAEAHGGPFMTPLDWLVQLYMHTD